MRTQPWYPVTALLLTGAALPALDAGTTVSLLTGSPIGELAVSGRLSVDLHAAFMVARTWGGETALNWFNCGYAGGGNHNQVGGNFGDFGLHVPAAERDDRYPHAVTIAGIPAVRFDGNDAMRANFSAGKAMTGKGVFGFECWLTVGKPTPGMALCGWQAPDGATMSAAITLPDGIAGTTWRHLVLNATADRETWWLDGKKVASNARTIAIADGHVLVLGGAAFAKPSFRGDLAALRIHDAPLSDAAIARNHQGGVMYGTTLKNWWRLEPDKWWVQESEHFRHCVDKAEMAKWNDKQRKEFDERLPGMFRLSELIYRTYSERLAMRSSVVSRRPDKRGDGIKYKTPIQPAGGSFMGCDDDFGWACQGAGFMNPHELVHGWQAMTGGALQGNWWEAHANFPQTYNGIYQTLPPGCVSRVACYFPAHGRSYYHDRLMFEHLAQTPEYGPMFIAKMWYDGATPTEKNPYPWESFTRLDPDPATPLAHEYMRMVMRNVTWDYQTFAEAPPGNGNTPFGNEHVPSTVNRYQEDARHHRADILRYARILLEPVPDQKGWFRPPRQMSPQQLGWNICPLTPRATAIAAGLAGWTDPGRGSDWRFGFVAVGDDGKPVYSRIAAPGETLTFTPGPAQELYLAVCAIPTKITTIDMVGDFRSPEQEPFPWRVMLTGCAPLDMLVPEKPTVAGAPHPNGGGFVDRRAKVDPTAFVAPGAQVLGAAQVLGQARILDHAVVRDATVQDQAIVSGHALVTDKAVVQDRARVRDWARVRKATVKDRVRVIEHAEATEKTISGQVVLKGGAVAFGNVSGTAVIDGSFAKGANDKGQPISKGKWFTWSWGQGKNKGEIDEEFGGLYLRMDFDRPHPWMAADDFGASWGWLVGSPTFASETGAVAERPTLLRPEQTIERLETDHPSDKPYAELVLGWLTPAESGDHVFWIAADDEGELWLGPAGATEATQRICGNPFYAESGNYGKFPGQKSRPVRLDKGRQYPFRILHMNKHQGSSLSVAWTRPGAKDRTVIGAPHLATAPAHGRPGALRRIWGEVDSIAALLKRPDFPKGSERVAGGILRLDGKGQSVELGKDVADLDEATWRLRVKWEGKADERIISAWNEQGDACWLSPATNGSCVFAIRRRDGQEQTVRGPALRTGAWSDVVFTHAGGVGRLYVNGRMAGENRSMTWRLEDVAATRCHLGRDKDGNHFTGAIDRFEVWTRALDAAELATNGKP